MSLPATASVERLCRRLAETPTTFLGELNPRKKGAFLRTEAIISDVLLTRAGRPLNESEREQWRYVRKRNDDERAAWRRRIRAGIITAWLLADDMFEGITPSQFMRVLNKRSAALSEVVAPRQLVEDSDRREELVRMVLDTLEVTPEGEAPDYARDRLSSLDSVERVRLLREARAAEEARRKREREIAAELARKRAAEQAARYDREY